MNSLDIAEFRLENRLACLEHNSPWNKKAIRRVKRRLWLVRVARVLGL